MSTPIQIQVHNSKCLNLLAAIERSLERDGIQEFLDDEAVPFLRMRTARRFHLEGDEVTGKWAPLRETTARIRARQGYGAQRPINIRTGALLRYVLTHDIENESLYFPALTGGNKELQSKLRVAQRGGGSTASPALGGPTVPAPPRPVLGLGRVDSDFIVGKLLDHVRSGA
jgi:hypothetical protein